MGVESKWSNDSSSFNVGHYNNGNKGFGNNGICEKLFMIGNVIVSISSLIYWEIGER